MSQHRILLSLVAIIVCTYELAAQCTSLRQQRNITFNTNRDCAPVDVTDYTITYFFNVSQDPSTISIRFEWNDPANSVDEYGLGDPGFMVDATQTEFTATGTFSYPENEDCLFEPQAFVVVDGLVCETSEQIQLVSSWARDNEFGGNLAINPFYFDVCFANPVQNAVFEDASEFNCNINQEPDNPNRQSRHTQFVYGMNHNAALSIKNLSLIDTTGSDFQLTDASGILTSTQTISGVTGAYFGPIEELPFPADGPDMESLVMNAPADSANQVGNVFRITLFNWNVCNPFNGDYINPNYTDAITTDAFIRIIAPPDPDFQTRLEDLSGIVKDTFCIGDQVFLENLTNGGFDYEWEIYNDPAGNDLLISANSENTVYTFFEPGSKLIRLTADNNEVPGSCEVFMERSIYISPAAIADFDIFDIDQNTPYQSSYCQDSDTSRIIDFNFSDQTINVEPGTEWRWEFYDNDNQLTESIPDGDEVFSDTIVDGFIRPYQEPGNYRVVYRVRNEQSGCETTSEKQIRIFPAPVSDFQWTTVCEGERTEIYDIESIIDYSQIPGDHIIHYDFDFSYDGVFNLEYRSDSTSHFAFFLDGSPVSPGTELQNSLAGNYRVAMRVTTASGCRFIVENDVIVNDLPEPVFFVSDPGPFCPGETISIYNQSELQNGTVYQLFVSDITQGTSDSLSFQTDSLQYTFFNDDSITHVFRLWVTAVSTENCTGISPFIEIEVFPDFPSGFRDVNYNAGDISCSPHDGLLVPDQLTQSIKADAYIWTISSGDGIIDGFPDTVQSVEDVFEQYPYQILNEGSTLKTFKINLEVFKDEVCITGSSAEIKVSPNPSSVFNVLKEDSCEEVLLTLEAQQPGLTDYSWSLDPMPIDLLDEGYIIHARYRRPAFQEEELAVTASLYTSNLNSCRSDTLFTDVIIESQEESITADFDFQSDTIEFPDEVAEVINNSTVNSSWEYLWLIEEDSIMGYSPGPISFENPGIYQLGLMVISTYCSEVVEKSIVVLPADPVVAFEADSLIGCAPHTVQFTDLSIFTDLNTYHWQFGDGSTSALQNPRHTYEEAGTYTVRLTASNSSGNSSIKIKEFLIEVEERPLADFLVSPETAYLPDQNTFFSNRSRNAEQFFWDFGDGGISFERDPSYQYSEVGEYTVTLIAKNNLGCADTISHKAAVNIEEGGRVRTPNAFTPATNGSADGGVVDGTTINDIFLPRTEGVLQFEMLIYNKWGQLLFKSKDKTEGWNGYFKGRLMPADVYVYKLYLTFSDGRIVEQIGDLTLVR